MVTTPSLKATVAGRLEVISGMWSPQLSNRRDLHVYLPPSYDRGRRRYPVVYMHDGQNLFDEATAFNGAWQVGETMERLGRRKVEALVVGIPNMGADRLNEYSPFVDARHGGGRGDAYLRFILRTIKPLIDRTFRTRPGRAFTGIFGSSMGGLISLYAFFRHPQTFGFCGAMSPALWPARRAIIPYVAGTPFVPGRLYLDVGTAEGPRAVEQAQQVRGILLDKGYRLGRTLLYLEEPGAPHSEVAWARRLGAALTFLLPRRGLRRWRLA